MIAKLPLMERRKKTHKKKFNFHLTIGLKMI